MIASFRSELVKLLRPVTLIGYAGAAAGFTVMLTIVSILNADNPSGHGPGNSRGVGLAQLAEPGGYLAGFESASSFLGIVALALFASSVAAEFSTGTIRALLVIDSRRRQLLAGKIAGLAAVLVVVVAFAAVVGAVVAFAISGSQGVDTDAWATTDGVIEGAAIIANLALATIVWGLFGALIAVVSRSAAISIAAGVAYFLIGEQLILHSLWPSTADWLPAGVLDALAEGGTESRAFVAALAL
ncbi:MAG: ABC transporter permease subunit [Acidimicrobiia bacterium]|nr:ABC transporter permease subunit [Acidimicrobiia bacterium]